MACRIAKLKWKMGKDTVGEKMEDHHSCKFHEMVLILFLLTGHDALFFYEIMVGGTMTKKK